MFWPNGADGNRVEMDPPGPEYHTPPRFGQFVLVSRGRRSSKTEEIRTVALVLGFEVTTRAIVVRFPGQPRLLVRGEYVPVSDEEGRKLWGAKPQVDFSSDNDDKVEAVADATGKQGAALLDDAVVKDSAKTKEVTTELMPTTTVNTDTSESNPVGEGSTPVEGTGLLPHGGDDKLEHDELEFGGGDDDEPPGESPRPRRSTRAPKPRRFDGFVYDDEHIAALVQKNQKVMLGCVQRWKFINWTNEHKFRDKTARRLRLS